MKRRGGILLALAVIVAAALASTAGAGSTTAAAEPGRELQQQAQARLRRAVHRRRGLPRQRAARAGRSTRSRRWRRNIGLKITLVTGDTPVEQGPAPAQTLAQKFVADKSVVAVIGPSTSGAVAASSQTYFAAGMAHISPSATRTSLTKGATKEATPSFFRVVPGDYIQGPTDANFMISKGAKKVVAVRLPGAVLAGSRGRCRARPQGQGRLDVTAVGRQHGDGLLVVRDEGPERCGLRLLPERRSRVTRRTSPSSCSSRARRRRCSAATAPTTRRSSRCRARTSPTSHPTSAASPADKAIIAGWKKDNPKSTLGSFGPPPTSPTQVALTAIKKACTAGKGQIKDRRTLFANVKRIVDPELDPRRQLPLLDEVERSAERQVLHLPDPVERLVQARRLIARR